MKDTNINSCRNCGATMRASDKFCHHCGQKNTSGKVSMGKMLQEFFADQFHLDAKLPRTFWVLFTQPGRLSQLYFEGKHKSYFKPVRIFGVAAIIFFALVVFRFGNEMGRVEFYQVNHDEIKAIEQRDSLNAQFRDSLASVKRQINTDQYNETLDSTFAPFTADLDSLLQDSFQISVLNFVFFSTQPITISKRDQFTLTDKELIQKYQPKSYLDKLVLKQQLNIMRDMRMFVGQMIKNISWMFFIITPFFSLLLKLIYIRRKRYYVEHVIFTLHIHAFLFLLFGINILLEGYVNSQTNTVIDIVSILGSIIYIFVAMKRFYQQNFWKTFIKFWMLFWGYLLMFLLFLSLTVIVSLIIF